MEMTRELLNQAKRQLNVTSDYALAKALNLPTQRISDYYNSVRVPDAWACLCIANALNRDFLDIMAIVRIDVEKDELRREAWRKAANNPQIPWIDRRKNHANV